MLNGTRNYRTLYERSFRHRAPTDRLLAVRSARPDYAVIVKVLHGNYVADVDDVVHAAAARMRLMDSCFYNHYTVFLLAQHSRHTDYLNRWIRRYREVGVLQHWSAEMTRRADDGAMRSFFGRPAWRRRRETHAWGVRNLHGALAVLAVGYAVGGVVFVGELAAAGKWRRF